MDSFELNKIIGGLLATVFVVFSLAIASDAIFDSPAPEKEGFVIAVAEETTAEAGDKGETAEAPIGPMIAAADAAEGEKVFKKCASCHTVENGGANKVGPNLWNIVNRPVASHEGFGYSAPIKEFANGGTVWDYEHLNKFITSPKGLVKGTAMGFAGLKKAEERAALIAYLRTQADSPAALPSAEAAAPAAEEKPAEAAPAAPAAEEKKPE
ncbi:MAG: cytochrome c family protein [Notoacmeibacter sp.]|nr:cytochrome c family protein [Notoacmeibacter sp.]MCC0032240.1 cytochrome c family protein [Brucellaceae bacterium]